MKRPPIKFSMVHCLVKPHDAYLQYVEPYDQRLSGLRTHWLAPSTRRTRILLCNLDSQEILQRWWEGQRRYTLLLWMLHSQSYDVGHLLVHAALHVAASLCITVHMISADQ